MNIENWYLESMSQGTRYGALLPFPVPTIHPLKKIQKIEKLSSQVNKLWRES